MFNRSQVTKKPTEVGYEVLQYTTSKELDRTIAKVKRLIDRQTDHYRYELTTEPPR